MKLFCVQNDTNKFCDENKAVRNKTETTTVCETLMSTRSMQVVDWGLDVEFIRYWAVPLIAPKQLAVRVTHNRRNVPVCWIQVSWKHSDRSWWRTHRKAAQHNVPHGINSGTFIHVRERVNSSLWAERNLWPRLDVVSLSFYSRQCNFLFHLYFVIWCVGSVIISA